MTSADYCEDEGLKVVPIYCGAEGWLVVGCGLNATKPCTEGRDGAIHYVSKLEV
jgi:hypothetical protein